MNATSEITLVETSLPDMFTPREQRLLQIFGEYLSEIFAHDDAKPGVSLRERIDLHAFDLVEAAGDVLATENHDLAATFSRRACRWHELGSELSQFLAAEGPTVLDDLPIVHGMDYRAELEARHGEEVRRMLGEAAS